MAKRIIHKGSSEAQSKLYPLGKSVPVSQKASDLIQELRNEAAKFGNAQGAEAVETQFHVMQQRMFELAEYVGMIEKWHGTERDTLMKF